MQSSTQFSRRPPQTPVYHQQQAAVMTTPSHAGASSHQTPQPPAVSSSRSSNTPGLKPPKAPEKPLVPYMRYSRKMWAQVREQNPDNQLWDIGKIIGQKWRELPDTDKLKMELQAEYDLEKVEYDKLMKVYHGSKEYQDFVAAKQTAKQNAKNAQATAAQNANMVPPPNHTIRGGAHGNTTGQAMPPHARDQGESGVYIQPVDEMGEGDSHISVGRDSCVRFERNHRLVAELFGEGAVTDPRTIVTQHRMDMLRKQADSLHRHQKKLEDELQELGNRFNTKKQKIEDDSSAFTDKLKKICDDQPNMDEAKYEQMVEKHSEKLLEAYKKYQEQQKAVGLSNQNGAPIDATNALTNQETAIATSAENNANAPTPPATVDQSAPGMDSTTVGANAEGTVGNDGGTVGNDGGTVGNDGGTVGNDGGTVGNDGGTVGNDGGTVGNDGGTVGNDGGTTVVNGGNSANAPTPPATFGETNGEPIQKENEIGTEEKKKEEAEKEKAVEADSTTEKMDTNGVENGQ